jgi:uncharacterized protein YjiS (DUF1127 family)
MYDDEHPELRPAFYEIERQAQLERVTVINALMRATACGLATWLRTLGRAGVRIVRNLAAKGAWRSRVRALQALDDRTLADIGLPRGEIEFAVRSGRPMRAIRELQRRHHGRHRTPAPWSVAA